MSFLVICILLILLHFGVPTSVGLQKQEKQIAAQSVATAPIKPLVAEEETEQATIFHPLDIPKKFCVGDPDLVTNSENNIPFKQYCPSTEETWWYATGSGDFENPAGTRRPAAKCTRDTNDIITCVEYTKLDLEDQNKIEQLRKSRGQSSYIEQLRKSRGQSSYKR